MQVKMSHRLQKIEVLTQYKTVQGVFLFMETNIPWNLQKKIPSSSSLYPRLAREAKLGASRW